MVAPRKPQRLPVGARLFYPGHGVVTVIGIEDRSFAGNAQSYYVLALLLDRGTRLMVPVAKVAQAGLRDLVSASMARTLMKAVTEALDVSALKSDPGSRKVRATGYTDALRSGSPERYTEALRELLARFRSGKLSPGEHQTFQQALAMFVDEMSAALDKPREDIRADLRSSAALPATGW